MNCQLACFFKGNTAIKKNGKDTLILKGKNNLQNWKFGY